MSTLLSHDLLATDRCVAGLVWFRNSVLPPLARVSRATGAARARRTLLVRVRHPEGNCGAEKQ